MEKYGVLQGALIATRLFAIMGELNLNGDSSLNNLLEKEPERLIGIWYDEACLPQGERTQKEALKFQTALQHLPEFVQHSNVSVVALRELQDDYEQRGWCMMEFMLATGQSTYAPLVYRYDLDREPLQINRNMKAGLDFATYLEGWKRADRKRASEYWMLFFLQTNTLPDSILKEEKTPLLSIRITLVQFVATQTALFIVENKSYPKDKPIEILKRLQSKTSLLTTIPEDGILVYLMIWVGGSSSKNPLRWEFEGYLNNVIEFGENHEK